MLKTKPKSYNLAHLDEQPEDVTSIYKMISLQEKTLDDILTKYKGDSNDEIA